MNSIKQRWFERHAIAAIFFGFLCVISVQAYADSYNAVLKQNGTALTCTAGGFNFTKTTAGTFPLSGLSISVAANCVTTLTTGFIPATTFNTGTPNLIVQNVTMNGEVQGANVEGIAGDLTNGLNGTNRYTIRFAYSGDGNANISRTFTIIKGQGQTSTVASGTYYLRNTRSIPEPETILLILSGFVAFGLARRIGRNIQ